MTEDTYESIAKSLHSMADHPVPPADSDKHNVTYLQRMYKVFAHKLDALNKVKPKDDGDITIIIRR